MRKGKKIKEEMVFLKRFLRAPRQVGSIAPSSGFLTRAMLGRVDWERARAVAELGAGTGVFTREIAARAHPEAKILVFEVDPALRRMIRASHPGLRLYRDAQKLREAMREEGIERLDFVISSLPFTVLPHEVSEAILDAVQDSLASGGRFVAYQYSSIMKHWLERRFPSVLTRRVLFNIPPALVYDCGGDCRK